MSPLNRSRRLFAVAAAVAAATLLFTGCAGEPSPVMKAIAKAAPIAQPKNATVADIQPAGGSVSGGTATITGTNLDKVASVQIGGQAAPVTQPGSDKIVVTVPQAANFAAGAVPIVVTAADGKVIPTAGKTFTYQVQTPVDQQLSYAMAHWNNYNTAQYGDLNPVGGDCANFVSQTLIARGWQMNSEWYNHDAAADWSPAWGYVPAMDDYFRQNATQLGLTRYSLDQRDKIKVGDIVMFDWNNNNSLDHVQIVSAVSTVNGKVTIQMAGHNTDTDYRDLDHTITVDHPGATGHFWSLSK
ncbi:amidase domain-containing protein [Leifsonia sp. NPDC056824]|uniref:amidase domain-containing protein n=1 Tax=Leifsonia sp. NPDC056824 TaxID=3345953 RepID=UPI00368B115A